MKLNEVKKVRIAFENIDEDGIFPKSNLDYETYNLSSTKPVDRFVILTKTDQIKLDDYGHKANKYIRIIIEKRNKTFNLNVKVIIAETIVVTSFEQVDDIALIEDIIKRIFKGQL